MTQQRTTTLCARLLVLSWLAVGAVAADPPPDPPDPPGDCEPSSCLAGEYAVRTKECPVDPDPKCISTLPASALDLNCQAYSGGIWCEAWPQSDYGALQYSWSVSGDVSNPYSSSPTSPVLLADCEGLRGWVQVIVTLANGAQNWTYTGVNCHNH